MSVGLYLDDSEVAATNIDPLLTYRVDPLKDSRWSQFIQKHPSASVFHSRAWLSALFKTYGYRPVAYTTSAPADQLQNAIVVCRVESWLTGRRLVSLPFSDHCDPLVDNSRQLQCLVSVLEREVGHGHWRYLEIRSLTPLNVLTSLDHRAVRYTFHCIDLEPDLYNIFSNFHKNSIQRKIRRAERERLTYLEGSNDSLLDMFYTLFAMTRRRHRLPPQPKRWFENLMESFGNALKIRVALKDGRAVAAMITLRHKKAMVYKYGASDAQVNRFGGMHMLFWKSIQEAKQLGLRSFDLGRSDADQSGLITFKGRWGAMQSPLSYSRYGEPEKSTHIFDLPASKWKTLAVKQILTHVQPRALSMIGRFFYKHIG